MSPSRLILGLGLVLALAIALLALTGPGETDSAPPTTSVPPVTTGSVAVPTTIAETSAPPTTTLEQREEEVAGILHRNLVTWFRAIYEKDEELLWATVATDAQYEAGLNAIASVALRGPPTDESVRVEVFDILLDREDCLVVHYRAEATALLGPHGSIDSVEVLWPHESGWRTAGVWSAPDDLWQPDCDLARREERP